MSQPVRVVAKPTAEFVVVRPRSAHPMAVQDTVERFSISDFYVDPENPADRPQARRAAENAARQAARQRAAEINAGTPE